MNTYDYRHTTFRFGFFLIVLSGLFIMNLTVHFSHTYGVNGFTFMITICMLLGCIGVDVIKSSMQCQRRRECVKSEQRFYLDRGRGGSI